MHESEKLLAVEIKELKEGFSQGWEGSSENDLHHNVSLICSKGFV